MFYGKANHIDYNPSAIEIVLEGNASIIMDSSSISGETLDII
ncbi:LptA/OstA family protein [Acinetobacter sp. ANC 3929]|nr:LptA/OstA family protein [Acinetobacter sp. ANC 3929]MCH7353842.1 hypothetical protein [Acinetobacter sp. NIPH 2023]